MQNDTIAAIATPPGRGGVGVVRVSGPLCQQIATTLLKTSPKARLATYKPFYNNKNEIIDQGIALYFVAPHSFTGEDVLELQGHGGPMVMQLLLSAIISLGARIAKPGEFSERAFLNGKIDLAQAEAVADLIDATTEEAARSALKSLQGVFSKEIAQLAERILHLRIYVEAAIDFPDEEIDFLSQTRITQQLDELIEAINAILQKAKQGRVLKEGLQVVIVGQPNAGKSSLLNALTQQDSAIVAPIAGTTRDLIRETIQIDGLPIHIVDTAGIRMNPDVIEEEGIKRAHQQLALADCILLVADCTESRGIIEKTLEEAYPDKIKWIFNKIDLIGKKPEDNTEGLYLSAKENQGIDLLRSFLKKCAGYQEEGGVFMARKRHIDALEKTVGFTECARHQWANQASPECAAEELRAAHDALGEIIGKVSSDALLGNIFSSFCIGK